MVILYRYSYKYFHKYHEPPSIRFPKTHFAFEGLIAFDRLCSKMAEPAAPPAGANTHALARRWDAHAMVRESVRATGKLLAWVSPNHTGVANKVSLRLNRFVIRAVLEEWVVASNVPKSPPIGWLREEAGCATNL